MGCLGMLSGGIVWAEPGTVTVEDSLSTQPTPNPSEVEVTPPETPSVQPEWTPAPAASEPTAELQPAPEPTPAAPVAPEAYELQTEPIDPPTPSAQAPVESGSDAYIDPTEYSLGATDTYEAPSEVVVTERSSGCQTVVGGSGISQSCGTDNSTPQPSLTPSASYAEKVTPTDPAELLRTAQNRVKPSAPIPTWSPERTQPSRAADSYETVAAQPAIDLGPVRISSSGVSFAGATPAAKAYFNRLRPPANLNLGNLGFIFPLTIPAPITSVFGWRIHPISGDARFHAGTDLGAPMGTPVVAALAGKVAVSEFMGGYGLTVVMEHKNQTLETLYAHLSEIFVKPGEEVKQGTVIGRVGSTGNSTGPHLHFEMRQRSDSGWVTVDPGSQLEFALAQLAGYLQVAQADPQAVKSLEKLNQPSKDFISPEKMPFVEVRADLPTP